MRMALPMFVRCRGSSGALNRDVGMAEQCRNLLALGRKIPDRRPPRSTSCRQTTRRFLTIPRFFSNVGAGAGIEYLMMRAGSGIVNTGSCQWRPGYSKVQDFGGGSYCSYGGFEHKVPSGVRHTRLKGKPLANQSSTCLCPSYPDSSVGLNLPVAFYRKLAVSTTLPGSSSCSLWALFRDLLSTFCSGDHGWDASVSNRARVSSNSTRARYGNDRRPLPGRGCSKPSHTMRALSQSVATHSGFPGDPPHLTTTGTAFEDAGRILDRICRRYRSGETNNVSSNSTLSSRKARDAP